MKEILLILTFVFSLFKFSLDYLSNKLITHNERIIAVITLIHHIIADIVVLSLVLLFFTHIHTISLLLLLITLILHQITWVINNDNCPISQTQHSMINEKYKNYKWISTTDDFIKKYIRGDEWVYSDIRNNNKKYSVLLFNAALLFYCLKKIIFK